MKSPGTGRPSRDLWLVAAVAVSVRAVYLLQIRRTPLFDYLHLDPLYYFRWAQRIAGGDWLGSEVFEQSPLYPYGLGLFLAIFGERLLLLRAVQMCLGVVACVGIALVGRAAFDRRAGLAAGLLAATYGPFPFYEGQVMKSFLSYVLVTAAILFLLWGRPPQRAPAGEAHAIRIGYLALAGAAVGLLALVRDNALVLSPAMAAWVALAPGVERRLRWRGAAILVLGSALFVAPAMIRNLVAGGEVVLITSGGGEVFYIGNYPEANGAYLPPPWVRPTPELEHEDFRAEARRRTGRPLTRSQASRYWFARGFDAIRADPLRWLGLEARKLALFWNHRELPDNYSYALFARQAPLLRVLPGFGLAAALGLVGIGLTWRRWRELLPLYLVLGAYLAGVLLFFNFARFRLPAVPVLLTFAGATMAALVDAARRAPRRAAAITGAALVVFLILRVDLTSADDAPGQEEMLLGYAHLDAGEAARAAMEFERARALLEAFAGRQGGVPPLELGSACFGQGTAYLALARAGDAIEPLRCAAERSPDDPDPLMPLARALRQVGRTAEAEATLRRLVALRPTAFAGYFDLGQLAFERGDDRAALEWFERGKESAAGTWTVADQADYHFGVALVLLQLRQDRGAALPHLREVLRLRPDHEQAAAIRQELKASGG